MLRTTIAEWWSIGVVCQTSEILAMAPPAEKELGEEGVERPLSSCVLHWALGREECSPLKSSLGPSFTEVSLQFRHLVLIIIQIYYQ